MLKYKLWLNILGKTIEGVAQVDRSGGNVGNIKILNLVITIDLVPGVIQGVMVVNALDV